jgi:hypothetical protein
LVWFRCHLSWSACNLPQKPPFLCFFLHILPGVRWPNNISVTSFIIFCSSLLLSDDMPRIEFVWFGFVVIWAEMHVFSTVSWDSASS